MSSKLAELNITVEDPRQTLLAILSEDTEGNFTRTDQFLGLFDEEEYSRRIWIALYLLQDIDDPSVSIRALTLFIKFNRSKGGFCNYQRAITDVLPHIFDLMKDNDGRVSPRNKQLINECLDAVFDALPEWSKYASNSNQLRELLDYVEELNFEEQEFAYDQRLSNHFYRILEDVYLDRRGIIVESESDRHIAFNTLCNIHDHGVAVDTLLEKMTRDSLSDKPFVVTHWLTDLKSIIENIPARSSVRDYINLFFSHYEDLLPYLREAGQLLLAAYSASRFAEKYPETMVRVGQLIDKIEEIEPGTKQKTDDLFAKQKIVWSQIYFDDPPRGYNYFVKRIFKVADEKQKDQLLECPQHSPAMEFFQHLVSKTDTSDLSLEAFLGDDGVLDWSIINDPSFSLILEIILKKPEIFRFEISVIMTVLPVQLIPGELRSLIKPVMQKLDLKLKSKNGRWSLCDDTEPRMMQSLRKTSVVVVGDTLVMKMIGKPVALCIKTTTTNMGLTLLAGSWYSPVDALTRQSVKSANASGQLRIPFPDKSEWALMRGLEEYDAGGEEYWEIIPPDILLQVIASIVDGLPQILPSKIDDMAREDFADDNYEDNDN